jgi:hypothetical protein
LLMLEKLFFLKERTVLKCRIKGYLAHNKVSGKAVPRMLSKTTLALVFFALTLVLSVIGLFVMASIFHPDYFISARKLDQKPDQYFTLENPDSYFFQAIDTSHLVEVRAFEDTEIYGLFVAHNTSNAQYNNSYYSIGFVIGDNIPPAGLPMFLLAAIVISIIAIAILAPLKIANHFRG